MAIFVCQVKNIARGKGKNTIAAAAYRSGSKFRDEQSGRLHNYSRKQIDHSQIIAPSDTPEWVYNREKLWNEVEAIEKRKDARLAKEVLLGLPVELNHEQNLKLAQEFVKQHCVSKGMVADLNFHDLSSNNPHCHVMLTTRHITADGFGLKNRDWNNKQLVIGWRKAWEQQVNQALAEANSHSRISSKSNEAQGIDRIPQIKLSAAEYSMMQRGDLNYRAEAYQQIKLLNQAIEANASEVKQLEAEMAETKLNIATLTVEAKQPVELPHPPVDLSPEPEPEIKHEPEPKPIDLEGEFLRQFLAWILKVGTDELQAELEAKYAPFNVDEDSDSVSVYDLGSKRSFYAELAADGSWSFENDIALSQLESLMDNFADLSEKQITRVESYTQSRKSDFER